MNSKKKIYIFGAIFGIINLLLIILVIFPLVGDIEKSPKDLISQKGQLLSLEKKEINFTDLKKAYQTHQADFENIETFFIDSETPIEFISFLENIAQSSQGTIKISLASEKKEETNLGSTLAFNISLDSSFPNFLKFLEKLENSQYLIEILNLNIKKSGGESFSGNINAALSIRVLTK
jgi:hypothetical protein